MSEIRSLSDVPEALRNQTSQPLSPELQAEHERLAKRNAGRDFRDDLGAYQQEREEQVASEPAPRPRSIGQRVRQKVDEFFGPSEGVQTPPEAPPGVAYIHRADDPPEPEAVMTTTALEPPKAWQPAASDSDTPSRGIPRPIADQGKQITGGFGGLGPAQYFPLDGHELGVIVQQKLDALKSRIQNDLRFSMATTYPRVRVFVEVTVQGFADVKHEFQVKAVPVEHDKTPVEVAREYADEVCFVVMEHHIEMLPDGESVTPPNKARIEAGLQVPQMQRIATPSGGVIVDRL